MVEQIRSDVAGTLGIAPPKKPYDDKATYTNRQNSDVHLSFQRNIIDRKYYEITDVRGKVSYDNQVERLWNDGFTRIIKERYNLTLDCWSAIETSLLTFLIDACDPSDAKKKNPEFAKITGTEDFSGNFLSMSDSILEKMDMYCKILRDADIKSKWEELQPRLSIIKSVRNAIMHSSGYVLFKGVHGGTKKCSFEAINSRTASLNMKGIEAIPNMIYISEDGIAEIRKAAFETFDFINLLELQGIKDND